MDTRTERGAGLLAPAGTILSILACYGTLAVVGALSLMGFTLTVNVGLWAGAIVLSILACYGTLAVVGALSLMGITLAVNEGLWAGAIVLFALVAFAGLFLGWRVHRTLSPVLLGALGTGMILWTMTGAYSRSVEITGFACLAAAAWLDWRAKRGRGMRPGGP